MKKTACLLSAAAALGVQAVSGADSKMEWPVSATVAVEAHTVLKMANIFSDNMVLRRDVEVSVWGWALPGKKVTVSFKGQKVSAFADLDAKWMLRLAPVKADADGAEMEIKTADERIAVKNILVGEVWVCSGQSNMQFSLREVPDGEKQVAAAKYPQIRLLTISSTPSDIPVDDIPAADKWQVCDPDSVASFSAIGYFFGREISEKLNVPVGLIDNARGGTLAEAWTSYDGIKAEKGLNVIFDRHLKLMEKEGFDKRVVQWQKDLNTWNSLSADEKREWPVIKKWWRKIAPPYGYPGDSDAPSWLFNSLVNPLIPYAISGVIWYQGETNVPRGKEYGTLFPALINDWRKCWNQGDFPFYFVQIAPCHEFAEFNLTDLWTSQYKTAKTIKNCDMVSPIDVGDFSDPHPKRKEPIGKRLAALALAETYGKTGIAFRSPAFKEMRIEGDKIRVFFSDVSAQGLVSRDGKPLSWFEIAGQDGKYHQATAVIDGANVVATSAEVKSPCSIRFSWNNAAEPNLSDKNGLPVLPFSSEELMRGK
ncbi:MAG: 9-O-acetylesterase [Lentisphaerae bacterium]|nr:9-O-acetylesterase [Lentisphaerota bacterium]